ncbi:MAG: energy-coupling factor transporter ATPase [Syntrophobacteraceae bacterium]
MHDTAITPKSISQAPSAFQGEGTPPLFEVRSLRYLYPDGRTALDGIDLTIRKGDRIALVGQNGAGKTTLALHLNGLFRPGGGTVLYEGLPLEGGRIEHVRQRIGMLFQDPDDQLFCNTLDEDVAFGPQNQGLDPYRIESRVTGSLRKVGLEDFRFKAPHRLSYGQKKRAAFATILAMNPEMLILDEPTANLDPKQENLFAELLRDFTGTLVCISHDLPFLYGLCSRAVVLENGKVHHDFSFQELVSHRHYLREHGLDFTFRLSCCRGEGNDESHDHPHTHTISVKDSSKGAAPKAEVKDPSRVLVEMNDYRHQYSDGTWGIRDIGFVTHEGENVAIIGENGAGKSTLVSCIAGIIEGQGEYSFDGKAVSGKRRNELWRHIGVVFQDPADQLFTPSCREEVAFGPKQLKLSRAEVETRVEEALALVRLTGFEDRVPHNLSAGERKRLALASVLSMRPRVLILDEPTANLDPRGEQLFCDILRQLPASKILISHDIDIISLLCERVVVMHRGNLIRDYPVPVFLRDEHLISVNGLDYTFRNACCREITALQGVNGESL